MEDVGPTPDVEKVWLDEHPYAEGPCNKLCSGRQRTYRVLTKQGVVRVVCDNCVQLQYERSPPCAVCGVLIGGKHASSVGVSGAFYTVCPTCQPTAAADIAGRRRMQDARKERQRRRAGELLSFGAAVRPPHVSDDHVERLAEAFANHAHVATLQPDEFVDFLLDGALHLNEDGGESLNEASEEE